MAAKGVRTTGTKYTNKSSNVSGKGSAATSPAAKYVSTSSSTQKKSTPTTTTKNTAPTTKSSNNAVTKAVSNASKIVGKGNKTSVTPITTTSKSGVSINTPTGKFATNSSYSSPSSSSSSSSSKGYNTTAIKNVDSYVDPVKAEAQRQKDANQTYVNNMLNQLVNENKTYSPSLDPNASPAQRTQSYFDILNTARNDSARRQNAISLLKTLQNSSTPNAMKGDPRYAAPEEENEGFSITKENPEEIVPYSQLFSYVDPRYQSPAVTTNAMEGDPRFAAPQTSSLQQALEKAAVDSLVDNGVFTEVPNVGRKSAYDSLLNPTVLTGDYGSVNINGNNSTPNAMEGDPRYQSPAVLSSDTGSRESSGEGSTMRDLARQAYNLTASSKSSSSGSRGGRSGGSGSGVGTGFDFDINSLYDLLNSQLAEYDNSYNALMEELMNAYNANFGSLNDAYQAALNQLGLNYADTESLLNSRLANSQKALEDERTRALQEAYIARMLDQRNLEDQLGAYGLSGGATESVLSNMLNTYRNNRNKIEETSQNSLAELLQSYLSDLADARAQYNSGVLNAENNRLSASQSLANSLANARSDAASSLAANRANAYGNLYNTLANLALKG